MILYTLVCGNGHRFESWFRGSADFDDQSASGLVACPVCDATDVVKTIMAPAVLSRTDALPVPMTPPPRPGPLQFDSRHADARQFLKEFRDKVMSESEDVGKRFPDEARKMHEGDVPYRNIRGQATLEEARDLIEDGVAILPVPVLPEELN